MNSEPTPLFGFVRLTGGEMIVSTNSVEVLEQFAENFIASLDAPSVEERLRGPVPSVEPEGVADEPASELVARDLPFGGLRSEGFDFLVPEPE